MRCKLSLIAMIGALLFFAATSQAQTVAVAQISGTVVDESGAPIPGATVKATQTNTGASRVAVSGGRGEFVLPGLPTGPYTLEVTLDGFMTFQRTGIVLQVGATATINATLRSATARKPLPFKPARRWLKRAARPSVK